MRIALFNMDSLVSHASTCSFIERHKDDIVLVALSPAFRKARGGFFAQSLRHLKRSGVDFSNFLAINFLIPRLVGRLRPKRRTLSNVCAAHGIPLRHVEAVNSPETKRLLEDLGIDVIITSFFDQILSEDLIATAPLGAINVHISRLPHHRGPMPVIFGLLDPNPALGVTVHTLDPGIDTGPVLLQREYTSPGNESVLTVMRKLQAMGLDLVSSLLGGETLDRTGAVVQEGGSYESFPSPADISQLKAKGRRLFDMGDVRLALATGAEA